MGIFPETAVAEHDHPPPYRGITSLDSMPSGWAILEKPFMTAGRIYRHAQTEGRNPPPPRLLAMQPRNGY